MRTSFAPCASALLVAAAPLAQNQPPDFSGRWQLVEPAPAERPLDTLDITSPDELLITQTLLAIRVEHPSKPGTHPEAALFGFGSGGTIGGLPGRGASIDETRVWQIATQLVISRSSTRLPDGLGVRITFARVSIWRLEGPNRLVMEFGDERTGEPPRVAVRTYVRVAPR